jgi:predicted PurR-regulated permease PerM
MGSDRPRAQRTALILLLTVAFALAAWIASPLWVALVLGLVLGFTTQSIYERLCLRLRGRRAAAAALTTLGAGLVCLLLGTAALYVVLDELVWLVRLLEHHATAPTLSAMIGQRGARVLEHLGVSQEQFVARFRQEVEAAARSAASAAAVAAAAVTNALLGLVMALITTYYVLLDFSQVTRRLEALLPVEPHHTRALVAELREVGRGALVGTLATAIVQGVLAGVGYWMTGILRPAAWATLTAMASFVPLVGTAAIWIPMGIYLVLDGHVLRGMVELLWGALAVMALSDYVIRPRLVGNSGHGHPLLVLVAILGGLEAMGLPGLIVGPIVMSLFVAVLRLYERDVTAQGSSSLPAPPPNGDIPSGVHTSPRP